MKIDDLITNLSAIRKDHGNIGCWSSGLVDGYDDHKIENDTITVGNIDELLGHYGEYICDHKILFIGCLD